MACIILYEAEDAEENPGGTAGLQPAAGAAKLLPAVPEPGVLQWLG